MQVLLTCNQLRDIALADEVMVFHKALLPLCLMLWLAELRETRR